MEKPKGIPCSGTKNANHVFSSGVTVLYCIVLYCIVLYCIVLYCIVLYCIVLHCIALHCIALHCIALHCIALHCIALHCIALHYIVLYLYYIILETKTIFMFYIFNQMILPFNFSSAMFVQKSFKFSVTAISLSYNICSAFQN